MTDADSKQVIRLLEQIRDAVCPKAGELRPYDGQGIKLPASAFIGKLPCKHCGKEYWKHFICSHNPQGMFCSAQVDSKEYEPVEAKCVELVTIGDKAGSPAHVTYCKRCNKSMADHFVAKNGPSKIYCDEIGQQEFCVSDPGYGPSQMTAAMEIMRDMKAIGDAAIENMNRCRIDPLEEMRKSQRLRNSVQQEAGPQIIADDSGQEMKHPDGRVQMHTPVKCGNCGKTQDRHFIERGTLFCDYLGDRTYVISNHSRYRFVDSGVAGIQKEGEGI